MNEAVNQNTGNESPDVQKEGNDMNYEQQNQAPGSQGTGSQYQQPGTPPYGAGPTPRDPNLPYKSPALATWMSVFPGMGQAYLGYYQLGFTYVLTMAFCILLLSNGFMAPFIGPLLAFFWIFNLVDAHRRALNYNRALDGLSGHDLPKDFEMPSLRGNIPVGVLLMVVGTLILLDLRFNISMEWIEDWWPVVIIGFGGWLVFKGRRTAN